jgi:hypothetical protein
MIDTPGMDKGEWMVDIVPSSIRVGNLTIMPEWRVDLLGGLAQGETEVVEGSEVDGTRRQVKKRQIAREPRAIARKGTLIWLHIR